MNIKSLILLIVALLISSPLFAYDIFQELNKTSTVNKEYLPVDQAFVAQIKSDEYKTTVSINIAPEYYLYRHLIKVDLNEGNFQIKNLPQGIFHHDDFMGDSYVFFNELSFDIAYLNLTPKSKLTLSYQGCTQGMCYPPVKREIDLSLFADQESKDSNLSNIATEAQAVTENTISKDQRLIDLNANLAQEKENEQHKFSLLSSIIFFLIGISLAFTPCVFPMYPVLSLILFGTKKANLTQNDREKNFPLAFCFVQGIAVTYTVIGIACSFLGAQTHAFLQQPAILIFFSLIFIVLSLSMLGLYDLQIPSFITQRLQKISDQQKSGSKLGAFVVGIITSLVCSPCTTAPVSASLLYTIQHGNLISGTMDLYLMGFGMGIPMLIIGTFGKKILPRSGAYLKTIKQLLGILSLLVPIILLDRIIPYWCTIIAIAILIASSLILLQVRHVKRFNQLNILLILALSTLVSYYYINREITHSLPNFTMVSSLEELKQKITEKDRVLIDFYASWCTSCKQYEEETFSDPKVKNELKDLLLLRVDLSEQNEQNAKISNYFALVGLPSVALYQNQQKEVVLSGFYNATDFINALNNYLPHTTTSNKLNKPKKQ